MVETSRMATVRLKEKIKEKSQPVSPATFAGILHHNLVYQMVSIL